MKTHIAILTVVFLFLQIGMFDDALGQQRESRSGSNSSNRRRTPQIFRTGQRRLATEASGGSRQPSSLNHMGTRTLQNYSPYHVEPKPTRKPQLNDIVTVVVNEASSLLSEGSVDRRKTGLYDAAILDWFTIPGLTKLQPTPQTDGDPRVGGEIKQTYRTEADIEMKNSLRFTIACRVIDIRPNGNLVLEAHKTVNSMKESWQMSFTGIIRPEDISAKNSVTSDTVYGSRITMRQTGHVYDGIKRGWLSRVIDVINPF